MSCRFALSLTFLCRNSLSYICRKTPVAALSSYASLLLVWLLLNGGYGVPGVRVGTHDVDDIAFDGGRPATPPYTDTRLIKDKRRHGHQVPPAGRRPAPGHTALVVFGPALVCDAADAPPQMRVEVGPIYDGPNAPRPRGLLSPPCGRLFYGGQMRKSRHFQVPLVPKKAYQPSVHLFQ